MVRAMPARELVLDGEAIALRPDGTPQPFQVTMRRFGRKLDVERLQADAADHAVLLRRALCRRRRARRRAADAARRRCWTSRSSPANRVPRLVTAEPHDAAAEFAAPALATGHEGVMAKALDGRYAAGRRGQAWLKVKQARTLDLVILAAEWGSGRRHGMLSNLHLGARDPERGGFVMLGKTFKGLTDEMLAWQTKRFLELEIGRDDYTVYVRPEARRRDRVQRHPGEPAVSGRPGAALRARQAVSRRQDGRRGRHVRDDSDHLSADDR